MRRGATSSEVSGEGLRRRGVGRRRGQGAAAALGHKGGGAGVGWGTAWGLGFDLMGLERAGVGVFILGRGEETWGRGQEID